MPLVFVHGVNTRKSLQYDEAETIRNDYFKKIALHGVVPNPALVTIRSPYWGDYGAHMAWDNACLPLDQNEQFGGEAEEIFSVIWSEMAPDVVAPPDKLLLTLARKDLTRAVDCLWAAAMHTTPEPSKKNFTKNAQDAPPLAAGFFTGVGILGEKAVGYTRMNPKPAWLASVTNDDQFVEKLLIELDAWTPSSGVEPGAALLAPATEAFGVADIWNRMKEAAAKLGEAAEGAVSAAAKTVSDAASNLGQAAAGAVINPLVRTARPSLHKRVSLFIGDVFQYLEQRHSTDSGKIITEVVAKLDEADIARKAGDEKLIVVAHSMGGNISYDILTRVRPHLVCDLFVTVGSQVGVFAELGLFPSITIDPNVAPENRHKAQVPENIKRWINIFDSADVLGYATSRIFDRTEDYAFSCGVTALTAHSMYFDRPHFYERLRARILKLER